MLGKKRIVKPNHRLILRKDISMIVIQKLGISMNQLKNVMKAMNTTANMAVEDWKNFYVSGFVKFKLNKHAYRNYINKHGSV